jgi:hypothetical protein
MPCWVGTVMTRRHSPARVEDVLEWRQSGWVSVEDRAPAQPVFVKVGMNR